MDTYDVRLQHPGRTRGVHRDSGRAGRLHVIVRIVQFGELPVGRIRQVGILPGLHKHRADPWPLVLLRNPFLIYQGHLAVIYVHGRAALVPTWLRAEHRRFAPGLAVVVAARNQQPSGMTYHIEASTCLEQDLVHHRDAGRGLAPGLSLVVGQEHPDLVAGLVVSEIGLRAVQGIGSGTAVIDRYHEAPPEAFRYRRGVEIDAVRVRGGGYDLFPRQQPAAVVRGAAGGKQHACAYHRIQ